MITLRNISKDDLSYLHWLENLEEFWKINEHPGPYTFEEIEEFFSTPFKYYIHKQQRWIIYEMDLKRNIGVIDVFNFSESTGELGIGILIPKETDRKRGVGKKALIELEKLLISEGKASKLFALIDHENIPSIKLFQSCNFNYSGNRVYLHRIVGEYKKNLYE